MKERLLYMDALRGLAMLFVVMGHVAYYSFDVGDSLIMKPFISMEIPLFFLVSGYFSYKRDAENWSLGKIGFTIWKRFLLLVVPAVIFMLLYDTFVIHQSFVSGMFNNYKHGYWFTFALFGFNLIYFGYILLLKLVKLSNWLKTTILLLGGGNSAFCRSLFQTNRDHLSYYSTLGFTASGELYLLRHWSDVA